MAIRQRKPGVWEVRGYTGKYVDGKSTQVARTVHGTEKDAKVIAAELTVKPARTAGGSKLRQLIDEWIDIKTRGWADLTIRDQTSRAKQVAADPIGNMSVASNRCFAMSTAGSLGCARRTNSASSALIESPERPQERTLTNEEASSSPESPTAFDLSSDPATPQGGRPRRTTRPVVPVSCSVRSDCCNEQPDSGTI